MKVKATTYVTVFTKGSSEGISYISEEPFQLPYIGDYVTAHNESDKTVDGKVSEIKRSIAVEEKGKIIININVILV